MPGPFTHFYAWGLVADALMNYEVLTLDFVASSDGELLDQQQDKSCPKIR